MHLGMYINDWVCYQSICQVLDMVSMRGMDWILGSNRKSKQTIVSEKVYWKSSPNSWIFKNV